MTQTTERRPLTPPTPRPSGRTSRPSMLAPGALSATWALGAGLVALAIPVLLAWAADARSGSGAGDATRSAGQLWLLAHGARLTVPGGAVGLTPLGLMLVPLALLHRAGRHAATTTSPRDLRAATRLVVATAFPYATGAAFLAALCSTDAVAPRPGWSLVSAFLVAVVGAGSGVARETRLHRQVLRFPARVRLAVVAGLASCAVYVAAGSLVVGGSLAAHAGRVSALTSATDPGLVGGVALLLLSLALVPNAVLWGAAFVAGPGLAVGVGTSLTPFGTDLGAVPALPLLAALPGTDVPLALTAAVLLVPLVAGLLAGRITTRRLATSTWKAAAGQAALAGPVAGLTMAALAWLSGGPLGGGRLADVGPSPWQVGLAVLVEVAVVAAATAAVTYWSAARRAPR